MMTQRDGLVRLARTETEPADPYVTTVEQSMLRRDGATIIAYKTTEQHIRSAGTRFNFSACASRAEHVNQGGSRRELEEKNRVDHIRTCIHLSSKIPFTFLAFMLYYIYIWL